MENNVDIYAVGDPQTGKFLTFKTVGDQSPQMTYINIREGVDGFGNEQFIYVFKDAEDNIWNWGVRKTATITIERMNTIKFGQIVGLKFESTKPAKQVGRADTKIIKIYSDPKVVDQAWLDEQAAAPKQEEAPVTTTAPEAASTVSSTPETAQPVRSNIPVVQRKERSSTVKTIMELAQSKGLTNNEMTDDDVDSVIAEFAGMPLTEENAQKIIIKLASFASK